jgi:hypothetical protein
MGIETIIGAAAPIVGGLLGGGGSKQSGNATSTTQQQMDPRIANIVFGQNGSGGLLDKYQSYLDQPQSQALQGYGKTAGDYLSNYGSADMGAIRNAATGLMDGKAAPNAGGGVGVPNVLWNQYVGVDAPAQNNMDLSGSYNRFINGTPGANPYLDQSINGAIAQNRLGFQQLQDDSTKNLMQNVLPSIRSNSVLAGQYGGSRQGIAESNAIGTQQTELARAASQFGQNATNAAVGAKANAYETDSNRALSATQGLGAQQYGVASQNAQLGQASQFANQQAGNDASKFAASQVQNANQFNAGVQMQQNQLNNSAALGGAGLLSGLAGSAYGTATNADNYGINRATQVNGLVAPYLGANSTTTSNQPLYQNTGANILGGASAGLGLFNSLKGLF